MKLSFAMSIAVLALGICSVLILRTLFTAVRMNIEITDMYITGAVALEISGTDDVIKNCEKVRKVYSSLSDEQKSDPLDEAYLKRFEELIVDGRQEKFDRYLTIFHKNNSEITDIGLCLLDEENRKIVIVRSLKNKLCGSCLDFNYNEAITFDNLRVKYVDDFEKGKTETIIRTLIPLEEGYTGNLAGYLYVEENNKSIYIWTIIFAMIYILFFVLVIIMVWVLISMVVRRIMIKPLKRLSKAANKWADSSDKLEEKYYFRDIKLRSRDEIYDLKQAMEGMETELHDYMINLEKTIKEKTMLSSEIEITARLQAGMLPERLMDEGNGLGIIPFMKPARVVGGDFYDFFKIDDNRYGIVIADVSDKGVPASLLMVVSKTLLKNELMENPDDIAFAVKWTNDRLCERNAEMMFVTVFAGVMDLRDRTLRYVNAGHEDPIVYRKSKGEYEVIYEEHDVLLGIYDNSSFTERSIVLDHGDRLFIYTDGVTEAMDVSDNLYGMDRLVSCLNNSHEKDEDEIIDILWNEISDFQKGKDQADDVTMLLVSLR